MDFFSFVECSNRTGSLSSLFQLLVNCASDEGFSEVAYGALTYTEPVHLPGHEAPAIATNFPQQWCDRYFQRKYHEIDPVVRRTSTFPRPFLWDQLGERYQLHASEQRVLDESREAGLRCGVSVPLFGPLGRVSVVSFASSSDDVDPLQRLSHLNALAWQFHIAFSEIAPPAAQRQANVELSAREKDCLRWSAEGKSSWDIGVILKISENTVNFHLKNAMRKFGTTNRTVAVVQALRLNVIELPGRSGATIPL
ncbi:MAG TPA: autoinducer binding domain-containing protein [Bradyrhizobium sp.]|nr:autoinducer binding domain-containing protein [Bradyrhizobium sp.]